MIKATKAEVEACELLFDAIPGPFVKSKDHPFHSWADVTQQWFLQLARSSQVSLATLQSRR